MGRWEGGRKGREEREGGKVGEVWRGNFTTTVESGGRGRVKRGNL